MILQNIILPKDDICEESELYYHKIQGTLRQDHGTLILAPETEVSFLSYFNSFSVEKWRRYTSRQQITLVIQCEGDCEFSLWNTVLSDGESVTQCLSREACSGGECHLSFNCSQHQGLLSLSVKANHETTLLRAYFESSEPQTNPVTLAIGICTYRRESYVTKTLNTLTKAFLEDKTSPLYGHLYIYVSDNGQTLSYESLSNEFIRVMPNKNAGGAGGFGRCILEARKDIAHHHLTHILLMDDDIVLEPESILRTFSLLSMANPTYANAVIGGALLRLDVPYIQHANGERWKSGKIGFTKRGYDLRKEESLLVNEEDSIIDYNGWWFCCLPLAKDFHGMPLPIFIHQDDIEYGLRFNHNIITMNGISVWHDAFEHRCPSSLEYYNMRNMLITCAVHEPELSQFQMLKKICSHLIGLMLRYREKDQLLLLRAVEDYCKGVDFLKETDPVTLHQEIMKMGYAMVDVGKDLKQLHASQFYTPPEPEHLYASTGFSKSHIPSINGWLLPSKKGILPLPMGTHPNALYRYKKALLYEPETEKGFYVERKRKDLWITLGRCLRVWKLLRKNYKRVLADYAQHGEELTTETFWEDYLN